MFYTKDPTGEIPVLPDRTNGCSLQYIDLTHQDYKPIKPTKDSKIMCPDNCYPHVLKEIKNGLIIPFLAESTLPSCWKQATVTIIHKKVTKSCL